MDEDATRREAVRVLAPTAALVTKVTAGAFAGLLVLLLGLATLTGEPLPLPPVLYRTAVVLAIALSVALLRLDLAALLQRRRGLVVVDTYVIALIAAAAGTQALHGRYVIGSIGVVAVLLLAGLLARPPAIVACLVLIAVGESVLAVRSPDPAWSPAIAVVGVAALVTWVARHVAQTNLQVTMGLVEALAAAERRSRQVGVVADASRSIHVLDTEAMLEAVVEATEHLGWEVCTVYVPLPGSDQYVLVGGRGTDVTEVDRPRPGGVLAAVVDQGRTVVRRNYSRSEGRNERYAGIETVVGAPIVVEGQTIGGIVVGRSEPELEDSDVGLVELLAAQAGRAMETLRSFEFQRAAMAEVERASRLKDDFVATVSHEVRTPVQVVVGMAETLDERWDMLSPDLRTHLVTRLRRNAADLQGLVEALLDFSRLAGGALPVRPEAIDPVALAVPVIARVRRLYPEHTIRSPRHEAGHVRDLAVGDPVLVTRVIENLLVNACRHTPTATTVQVDVQDAGDAVRVSVVDDGPGIEATDLERLGERFYRGEGTHLRRETRGVGLGLAFCVEILSRHDTELEMSSVLGEGARFSFVLPRAAPGTVLPSRLPQDTAAPGGGQG